jgi:hypothetical protein
MRLRRVRLTLRLIMAAVALVALYCWAGRLMGVGSESLFLVK